jgi:hypothetical protein
MPVRPYAPRGVQEEQRLLFQLRSDYGGISPMAETPELRPMLEGEVIERPGFVEAMRLTFEDWSVTGAAAVHFRDRATRTLQRNEEFNPYDYIVDSDYYMYPWLYDVVEAGMLDDIANEEDFARFWNNQNQQYIRRQKLGQRGLAFNIAASLPSQIAEAATASLLIPGLGGAGSVGNYIHKMGTFGKIAVAGGVAAGLNAGQEALIQAIDEDAESDVTPVLYAAGMGAVFGIGLGGLGSTLKGGKRLLSDAAQHRLEKEIVENLHGPGRDGIISREADDVLKLNDLLSREPLQPGAQAIDTTSMAVLETPQTRTLIKQAKDKFGDSVEFHRSPFQDEFDFFDSLDKLDKAMKENAPADLGRIRGAAVRAVAKGIPVSTFEIPALRMANTPSGVARQAARTMMDIVWPTARMAEAGGDELLTGTGKAPAEAILWGFRKRRDDLLIRMDHALREGTRGSVINYTMADGTPVVIAGRRFHRRRFYRAVTDHLRQLEEARRGHRPQPTAPKPIADAAKEVIRYSREMGEDAVSSRMLSTLDTDRIYLPRRWLTDIVRERERDFRNRLRKQFDDNRVKDFETGKMLVPEERALIKDAVKFDRPAGRGVNGRGLLPEERARIEQHAKDLEVKVEELTEQDLINLDADLHTRYLEEVDLYLDGAAKSTWESITDIDNGHGVDHTISSSVTKQRVLQINETDFTEFLDDNLDQLVTFYDRQMSGRMAARLAIKQRVDTWRPLIKQLLGKDIVEEGYDPELLVAAIREDFRRQRELVGPNNQKALDAIKIAEDLSVGTDDGAFIHKLAELESRPVVPGDAARSTGLKLFLARNALRLPYMTSLGKVTISAIPDVANLIFYKSLTPRQIRGMGEALALVRRVPEGRHLEGIFVATSDLIQSVRSLELGDVYDMSDVSGFGTTKSGKAMAVVDRASDYAARKFSGLTLMNRWNTNMKRYAAHLVMDEINHKIPKIVELEKRVKAGTPREKAMRDLKLNNNDLETMSRLGFSMDAARRLTKRLDDHALDYQGKRVDSNHKGFMHPNAAEWAKADRELADLYFGAINSEVMNLIVEPKLGSRPLVNRHPLGVMFNQFQSFAYAWGTQLAPMAATRPAYQTLIWMKLAVGLGTISDAIHNQLSGRRTIEDSIELWSEKPAGMLYAGILRGGLVGWLARPLGMLESTPWGIGKQLGNEHVSSMNARPLSIIDQMGPGFGYAEKLATVAYGAYSGQFMHDRTQRALFNAMPYRNLWFLEAFNRLAESMGYDTPIGPEPRPWRPWEP